MLSTRNFQNVSSLSPSDSDFIKDVFRKTLRRDWGISDKRTFYEEIFWCFQTGHSSTYRSIMASAGSDLDQPFEAFHSLHPDVSETKYSIAKTFQVRLGNKSLVAWDLGRAAWLARMGAMVGYISESEAWDILEAVGKRIGSLYGSWRDYGVDYCIGRVFWGGIDESDPTIGVFESLVGPFGAWSALPWQR